MPNPYTRVMPAAFTQPKLWVYISGLCEILLGLGLLYEPTREIAVWGIITMLIMFMWVHFDMLNPNFKTKIPRWVLWLRLPLQYVLMYWAYSVI
ncbi:MAG: DoxX family protein [Weeksellaceae bacterium]